MAVKRMFMVGALLCLAFFLFESIGFTQSMQQGVSIFKQAQQDQTKARSMEDMNNALRIFERIGAGREEGIKALTLARTIGNKEKPKDSLLVVADPVFNMKDRRAQQASETRLSQREKEYNIQRMAAMEDSAGPLFPQLHETGNLADYLGKMYGSNRLSLTGLQANKAGLLAKIAPTIDQYGSVVFATHGVMSTHVPGLMEPFLALSMAPPGTDGFLKMSDILSLKMDADVVALTACQSGLGERTFEGRRNEHGKGVPICWSKICPDVSMGS